MLTTLLTLLLLGGGIAAEQIEVRNVGELVGPADLIARVKVVSVRETGARDGYAKVAWVQVAEAVKGTEAGTFFELGSDSVAGGHPVACPNVSYAAGEDVLLFARKLPDGTYHTLYSDTGKFPIREGRVDKHPFERGQSYDSAVAQVRREVKRRAGLAAAARP